MKKKSDPSGCILGVLWIVFLPFMVLAELLKKTK